MDISMDIMLAHLLIKLNTNMLCVYIIFSCLSFLLCIFRFIYVTESNDYGVATFKSLRHSQT